MQMSDTIHAGTYQTLFVMQGPPGSGKSHVASCLQAGRYNTVIYSTDDFFWEGGRYDFRPQLLPEFHGKNLERTKLALDEGKSVVVDNTNIQRWQCREYVRYAVSKGIPVVFVRVNGRFQNTHGVPDDRVEAMRNGMEDLTVETVLASKAPWETAA
jgi:predicted kinase